MKSLNRFRFDPKGLALCTALLVVGTFGLPNVAAAVEGSGDTGWTENNKRDCCTDAISLAQQDSADRCQDTGGQPKIVGNRGFCDWDAQGDDDDDTVYRCTATAEVDCW